ncbi:hypothetical protein LSTR_LSTR008134 [Laodelphax striatellus]|uniref:Uncharacterized protein n=1 Tax=Laodelphax striatellus TaxID=195883 RepID=A0A482XRK9_LAOST|nr:hypothetical protein LSTR_LSTR008134 [Laodelphax striatellus]
MIYKKFIHFFGCTALFLNSLQTCNASLSLKTLINNMEVIEESKGTDTSNPSESVDTQKRIQIFIQQTLTENEKLLLEKKEIRELLGEHLEVLDINQEIRTNLNTIGGTEIVIWYYLKKYPENAHLLKSASSLWWNAIDDMLSTKNDDTSSKELFDKLINAKNLDHIHVFSEITDKVLVSENVVLLGEEYEALLTAVFIRLCTDYHIATTSELERVLFRKISSLYQSGAFDDINDQLGEETLKLLFTTSSPQGHPIILL